MARILTLLVIAFLAYVVWRTLVRRPAKRDESAQAPTTAAGEDMLACARCGVNVPRSELREEGGRLVCASNPNCK